ncbi:MAG: hypothetical protein GX188_08130 [Syntrophomonadaceae bacterium]|nr:hypothetical protein [Syntrophomonadaceae bacterium]
MILNSLFQTLVQCSGKLAAVGSLNEGINKGQFALKSLDKTKKGTVLDSKPVPFLLYKKAIK